MDKCIDVCMGLNGHSESCRDCRLPYVKTIGGVTDAIYTSHVRLRDFPTYTRDELETWLVESVDFRKAYLYWTCSGHRSGAAPTASRIHQGGPLSLDNLAIRETTPAKSSLSKRVAATDKYGNVTEYDSIGAGAKATGADRPEVSKCCSGKAKTAAGHTWRLL